MKPQVHKGILSHGRVRYDPMQGKYQKANQHQSVEHGRLTCSCGRSTCFEAERLYGKARESMRNYSREKEYKLPLE